MTMLAGSLLGAIIGSGPLSNFPTIGHAIIAITFLILIICFAVQPILSTFGALVSIKCLFTLYLLNLC